MLSALNYPCCAQAPPATTCTSSLRAPPRNPRQAHPPPPHRLKMKLVGLAVLAGAGRVGAAARGGGPGGRLGGRRSGSRAAARRAAGGAAGSVLGGVGGPLAGAGRGGAGRVRSRLPAAAAGQLRGPGCVPAAVAAG